MRKILSEVEVDLKQREWDYTEPRSSDLLPTIKLPKSDMENECTVKSSHVGLPNGYPLVEKYRPRSDISVNHGLTTIIHLKQSTNHMYNEKVIN